MVRQALIMLSLGVLLAVAASSPAAARVWHASESVVSDACTATAPCTVATAVARARRGDTVQFAAGDCRCPFDTGADGVTFKGAPGLGTRMLWKEGGSGRHIVGILHDDIHLTGLIIDGEKRPNSGHGLVRVGTAKGFLLTDSHVINSGSTLLNIGGSWKESTIRDVQILRNKLCGSGFVEEHGEAIYIGDFKGSGRVDGVLIQHNEICQFSDNAIDFKPPSLGVKVVDNWIHHQVIRRHKQEPNQGTLVIQGKTHFVSRNLLEQMKGGKGVFNLTSKAHIVVYSNVIQRVSGMTQLIGQRAEENSARTSIMSNLFCGVNTTHIENKSAFHFYDNAGLDKAKQDCTPAADEIRTLVQSLVPKIGESSSLPELHIARVTYGETGENVIRIYWAQRDDGDYRTRDRTLHLDRVRVTSVDQSAKYPVERGGSAKSQYDPGYNLRLAEPYPGATNIRVTLQPGWLTAVEGVSLVVAWSGETQEDDPIQMQPGQVAICPDNVSIQTDPATAGSYRILCGSAK